MTEKNSYEGRSFLHKILIAVFIVVVIVTLIIGASVLYNMYFTNTEEVVKVEKVFIDVNGDGLQDYVRYAEVVLNKGNLNLTPSP